MKKIIARSKKSKNPQTPFPEAKSAFVIGSVSQERDIKLLAGYFKAYNIYNKVDHVCKEDEVPLAALINKAFEKIEKSDHIHVVLKPNGKPVGNGTAYEMVYALRNNKDIYVHYPGIMIKKIGPLWTGSKDFYGDYIFRDDVSLGHHFYDIEPPIPGLGRRYLGRLLPKKWNIHNEDVQNAFLTRKQRKDI